MRSALGYRVHCAAQVPQSGRGPLPDGTRRMWSPISSTLIFNDTNAVLVDAPVTLDQSRALERWLEESGRELTHFYITHGHGDHWFGAIPILGSRPHVRVLATAGTIAHMKHQGSPNFRASFWDAIFPGEVPVGELAPEVVGPAGFDFDGATLVPVELGHTDTDATTALHVPDADLVVAGDAVYNGVHPYLTESPGDGIQRWLEALDIVEGLGAGHVVAGHKDPARDDSPQSVAATRAYLQDAQRLLAECRSPEEFFQAMLARHNDRINSGALWGAAITLLR